MLHEIVDYFSSVLWILAYATCPPSLTWQRCVLVSWPYSLSSVNVFLSVSLESQGLDNLRALDILLEQVPARMLFKNLLGTEGKWLVFILHMKSQQCSVWASRRHSSPVLVYRFFPFFFLKYLKPACSTDQFWQSCFWWVPLEDFLGPLNWSCNTSAVWSKRTLVWAEYLGALVWLC